MFTLVSLKMQHTNFTLLLSPLKVFNLIRYRWCLDKIWSWRC